MISVAKFIPNTDHTRSNKIISRTFGKIAHIHDCWSPPEGTPRPNPEEVWRVEIIRETRPSQNRGCFIIDPIELVPEESICHLAVGMYDEQRLPSGVVLIRPFNPEVSWVMPLKDKRAIMADRDAYAMVVCLGGDLWDPLGSGE
ncbi:MAG TPA: hypothetical protein VM537_30755 [Anaerolineae bacterium]|nr:hypothetical protein [Anaerolineae bacterium]